MDWRIEATLSKRTSLPRHACENIVPAILTFAESLAIWSIALFLGAAVRVTDSAGADVGMAGVAALEMDGSFESDPLFSIPLV